MNLLTIINNTEIKKYIDKQYTKRELELFSSFLVKNKVTLGEVIYDGGDAGACRLAIEATVYNQPGTVTVWAGDTNYPYITLVIHYIEEHAAEEHIAAVLWAGQELHTDLLGALTGSGIRSVMDYHPGRV